VTLGAQSRLSYTFTDAARRVTLSGGDAFFAVTKAPARPFYVIAGNVQVRVLGTQFEVRQRSDEVSVAVAEGVVEVKSADNTHILRRGEGLVASRSRTPSSVHGVDTADLGAWRTGRLVYDDVELRDVIADANRYIHDRIVIADPALAGIRVTTSFRTSQVDGMIETLESALPIEVERQRDGEILLRARK
jgi:transmembrane sensor